MKAAIKQVQNRLKSHCYRNNQSNMRGYRSEFYEKKIAENKELLSTLEHALVDTTIQFKQANLDSAYVHMGRHSGSVLETAGGCGLERLPGVLDNWNLTSGAGAEITNDIETMAEILSGVGFLAKQGIRIGTRMLAREALEATAKQGADDAAKIGSGLLDDAIKAADNVPVAPTNLPPSLRNLKPGDSVPDGLEIVVRGSTNKPGTFKLRPGVDDAPLGPVTTPGKSATVATDLTVKTEIEQMFGRLPNRHDRVSGAFIDDVRAAGFDVIYAPTVKNPLHVRITPATSGFDETGREALSVGFDVIGKGRK